MKEFAGHVAFVTGGASGLGEQICRDLAEEGASVVVADIQLNAATDLAASLPTGDGSEHLAIHLDVTKKSQVEDALAKVKKAYGREADLIVNCAGIAGASTPFEDLPEEEMDRVMNVNFKGTFLVTQVFGKALLEANKTGSIVILASILAYTQFPGISPYCVSKAAVMQLTKAVAKEWGPKGIRVNSIHPGLIDTPLINHLRQRPICQNYINGCSLRRIGKPKDVSSVVLFALSDRSGYVTGAQLEVSGQGAL